MDGKGILAPVALEITAKAKVNDIGEKLTVRKGQPPGLIEKTDTIPVIEISQP